MIIVLKDKYLKDINKLHYIISENGFYLSLGQCQNIWSDYSDSFSSEWLPLPQNDEAIWNIVKWRVEKLCK